jgi:hypothetical protein
MSGAATAGRRLIQHDIDWSPVAGAVLWMPERYREPTLDEATALRILRCTPRSFAALRDLGLEPGGEPGDPRYDANDIRNAALYSRSGRTEVETALGAILSFLRGSEAELFGERRWAWEMTPAPPAGGDTRDCWVSPPVPEAFGGTAGPSGTGTGTGTIPAVRDGDRVLVPDGETLRGSMTTRGRPASVADQPIRAITAEILDSGVRWHHLSAGLKTDARAAFARGVGNCDTLSTILAERLAGAGYAPRTCRGWIIGITEVPHSWVEVTDGDGQIKVIDPSLLLLARHSSLGSPDFAPRALGAALSKIAPTRCPLAEPIGRDADGARREVRFACRPAAVAAAARDR